MAVDKIGCMAAKKADIAIPQLTPLASEYAPKILAGTQHAANTAMTRKKYHANSLIAISLIDVPFIDGM